MGSTYRKILLVSLLALAFTGCQYFKDLFGPVLQRPQVRIKDVQIVSTNFFELKLKIRFLVENPNSFALEFSNLQYDIDFGKKRVAHGVYKENFNLPAEHNTVIDIPLTVDSVQAIQILRDMFRKHVKIEMKLTGSVDFHSGFGATTISFEHNKELF